MSRRRGVHLSLGQLLLRNRCSVHDTLCARSFHHFVDSNASPWFGRVFIWRQSQFLGRSSFHSLFTAQRDSSRLLYRESSTLLSFINRTVEKKTITETLRISIKFNVRSRHFSPIFVIFRASLKVRTVVVKRLRSCWRKTDFYFLAFYMIATCTV